MVRYSEKSRLHMYVWCQGISIVETNGQTKQLKMPMTMLPNVKNKQLMFVTMDFKPCNRYNESF